jgi:hypothetical protein
MKSVQELIMLGKVPSDTTPADNQTGYPNGWPVFTDLSKQVQFDWDNLPSDRVRNLKNNPEYKAALEAFLLADAVPVNAAPPAEVTLAKSVEEELNNAATPVEPPASTASTEEVIPPAPVPPAPVVEESEGTKIEYPFGTLAKVKGGWEARVDNKDGSGVQVYIGKTKDEVIGKLLQAQAHASQKIRSQKEENERLLIEEPGDPAVARKRFAPRELTADEQFEFATAIASGDAVEINKAMAKRDAIIMGGKPAEVLGEINRTQDELEFEAYKATAKSFIKQNPDVIFTKELGDAMDAILLEKGWAYTVRNLNKCLAMQKAEGKVQTRVSTPATEVELPVPTQSREVAPASAASASAPPAAVPPAPPVPRPAPPTPPLKDGERLRPGSASTGASPRQASVRQGSTPATPVGLTAEEYNRMSVSETRRKYKTDLGFKTAVDKLIADGKI